MLSKAVNLLLIILLSSSLTIGVRRKSKIDVPIANAADAPSSDNAAAVASAAAAATAAEAAPNDAQPNKFEDQPSAQALAATEKPTASPIILQPNAISNSLPSSAGADSSSSLGDNAASSGENDVIECDPDMIGFEIITGYVRLDSIWTSANNFEMKCSNLISHFVKCNPLSKCVKLICWYRR